MGILEPCRRASRLPDWLCELFSQLRPGAFCAYVFIVFAVWDRIEFTLYIFVYIIICILSVRDRVSAITVLLLCSAGQRSTLFCAWYKGYSATPAFFSPSLSLSIE